MNLKYERERLGLSVRGLADALGINERSIRRMQNDPEKISLRTKLAVSNLLAEKDSK